MDSAAANAVLNRVSNTVRAVTRLMTTTSANREVCLSKVDNCLAHISSIRGVLNDADIDAVEASLHAMRSELVATNAQTAVDSTSYRADRPLTGMSHNAADTSLM